MFSRMVSRFVIPAVGLFGLAPLAYAAPQSRIVAINGSSRVPVQHTIPTRARVANDLGSAPSDTKLSTVSLHFNVTAAQQADLTQLLVDQQNPSSPNYHKWLTPEQFGARFGLNSADIAKISTWLTGQGFTVTGVARSSTFVTFSGTIAQVQQAFGTSIHTLSLNGEQHISNVTDPVLPSSIAGVVSNISGLNDFKVRARARVRKVAASEAVQPRYTSSVSGNHYIAPGDFNTIYDINPLLQNSVNGSGITIAVMGQTDISLADVAAFRSASGLSANVPTVKLYGPDPGLLSTDVDEAQLDVEWSGAVAPSASIIYVNSTDVLDTSLMNAIDNNLAPIMSVSYGLCESAASVAALNSFNQLFQQANAEGITIVGPSGDSGATDCDYQFATASQGLAVDFPASSPFVTGAGGTMFNEGSATGATSYWSASNGTDSGSAISYIPETVWNETSSTNGLASGGGGASLFFAKPSWQVGTGVPADASRDVPDISLNAASGHDGYLFCSKSSCSSGYRDASGNLNVVGGTSVAAPTFAGILALVEQKIGSRIGNANPTIYGLANSTYYGTVFHDITSGNNESPCDIGTVNCPNGGSIGYTATPGYDLASGWGSIDVFNFANSWSLVTPAGGTSVNCTPVTSANPSPANPCPLLSSTTITTSSPQCGVSGGGNVTFNVSVANGSIGTGTPPVPTGTVQLLVDNVASGSAVTIVNGAATLTLSTAGLSSGGHNVSVSYSGDASYRGSKGTLLTTNGDVALLDVVSSTQADFSLTPCTSNVTVVHGGTAPGITFTLTPFNGFQGSIALSSVVDSSVAASYTFSVNPVVINSTAAGTTSFVLTASQSSAKTGTGLLRVASTTPHSGKAPWYVAGSGASLACLLLVAVPRRRRLGALLVVLLSVAAFSASGCGGSSSSTTSTSTGGTTPVVTNATPGTYNITVTGVATTATGNIVHSATVTFVVQ
ncbi:MAG TPA: protease pro-enzyme activation domain-containing protein [Edaphobacter sp.]|nr:protease pro-enzyme activation domain-containing protein [Edaphobacter sp.]